MNHEFRHRVLSAFAATLEERGTMARLELATLDEAASGETKSSAGDKYETAREMFSQARDLQRRILEEAEAGLDWIRRQVESPPRTSCNPGAVVKTSEGWILLGPIPIAVDLDGIAVQGVSVQSPLGMSLKGARTGEQRAFRERTMEVTTIL